MKRPLACLLLSLALIRSSLAVVSSTAINVNSIIPDGDLNGIQSSMTLSGLPNNITDINVTFTIAGGFNGDFYAYLFHNSTSAILLNRAGRTGSSNVGYS